MKLKHFNFKRLVNGVDRLLYSLRNVIGRIFRFNSCLLFKFWSTDNDVHHVMV